MEGILTSAPSKQQKQSIPSLVQSVYKVDEQLKCVSPFLCGIRYVGVQVKCMGFDTHVKKLIFQAAHKCDDAKLEWIICPKKR